MMNTNACERLASVAVVAVAVLLDVACDVCDAGDDTVVDSATVRTQSDADDLEGVLCVLGDLHFEDDGAGRAAALDLSALADLQIVEGDLAIQSTTQPLGVSLPSLLFVGRRGIERDSERFRGGLFIQQNAALAALELDALTDVGGCIDISDNPLLDAGEIDDLFTQVRSHAFPGTCDGAIEQQSGNGGGGGGGGEGEGEGR